MSLVDGNSCLRSSFEQRNDANILLMRMKESPDMWTQAGTILEQSQSQHTRFIGLQVTDVALKSKHSMDKPATQRTFIELHVHSM